MTTGPGLLLPISIWLPSPRQARRPTPVTTDPGLLVVPLPAFPPSPRISWKAYSRAPELAPQALFRSLVNRLAGARISKDPGFLLPRAPPPGRNRPATPGANATHHAQIAVSPKRIGHRANPGHQRVARALLKDCVAGASAVWNGLAGLTTDPGLLVVPIPTWPQDLR